MKTNRSIQFNLLIFILLRYICQGAQKKMPVSSNLMTINKKINYLSGSLKIAVLICLFALCQTSIIAENISVDVHIRGIYDTRVTLLKLSEKGTFDQVYTANDLKSSNLNKIDVPERYLPGEFILRFDYRQNESDTPYPSEKRIIVGNQDLELWVNPIYCNNPDSTWFQKDEKENTSYTSFMKENSGKLEMLGLLQNFLLNYDDTGSELYHSAVSEFEKRRIDYNIWVKEQVSRYKELFVSSLIGFNYIPQVSWTGSEAYRKKSLRDNYFEGASFTDPMMVRTAAMKEWMDRYVNLYGELATSIELRDSLFSLAGKVAIEKAKGGDPSVYGWMVDYFFNGYESFNILQGIQMLQPYLDDPRCLTSKRQEINRRLEGIQTLKPGIKAPDIELTDSEKRLFNLYSYNTGSKYLLLLFWSADCNHCKEMMEELYPYSQKSEIKKLMEIIAISLDETETEIIAWQNKIKEIPGWKHIRLEEGVRSKAAADYFILSTPVMILVDAETKMIRSFPESVAQVRRQINR